MCGIELRKAPNRLNENERDNPCPAEKIMPIKQALKQFGEI